VEWIGRRGLNHKLVKPISAREEGGDSEEGLVERKSLMKSFQCCGSVDNLVKGKSLTIMNSFSCH